MDDQLLDLEAELRALRPRRPSPQLAERIELDLATDAITTSVAAPMEDGQKIFHWPWFGAALAAAAAVAVVATVGVLRWQDQAPSAGSAPVATLSVPTSMPAQVASTDPVAPASTYRPVRASNVLYDLKDEGVVYLDDRTPARQMRYRYLDTYTWKNPKNNASVKWSMPRDEVRVMPASLTMN